MVIFKLLFCIASAWMAGVLTVAGVTRPDNGYWVGVFAALLCSLYGGITLIGYVSEHPL